MGFASRPHDDAAAPGQTGAELPLPPRPRRSLWTILALLALAALVVASFVTLDLQWRDLFSAQGLGAMAQFVRGFFPPETGPVFLWLTARAALETLAMSLLGTALAAVGGLALALLASAATTQTRGQRGWRSGRSALRGLALAILNLLRAVPELIWAVLLLIAAGLGPMAGTLALALHTSGVLGRLFAQSLESAAPDVAQALRLRGVGALQTFAWATWPQIAPQLLSYTLYRWENNIRAATVLGIVGAGGLGQMLSYHLGLFHMRETGTVLLAMLLLVAVVDGSSFAIRRVMAR
ncbi:phosphonate ABC transporter, permease protein PhnE [Vandammella animalimorsus]|uniref:Phosphonate ABC transporter, permease protein PhnE n=1 Tax=Vandammella animalimorsus TaxID=2029117 RepID=A0A3M6RV76_9BURK|nr:phosphonate ABC transporter, permease protein PhnE [Vandammella animalimorsus]RMX18611.1 phosphonate ABC transporter, permease protein PhnE [Vandammella animalimorsus]